MPFAQPEPHIFCIKSDGGQQAYIFVVDGQQLAAFDMLHENLDLLYRVFWIFKLKCTPSVQQVYKFLEHAVFSVCTSRAANCVSEWVRILEFNPKK